MIFSKSCTTFRLAFALPVMTLVLTACVKPQNHDSKIGGASSFFIDKMAAPTVDTASTYSGYSLPEARLYTFTACVRDRRTEEALPSAPFKILGGATEQEVRTNKDGCLVWSERIAFDYLADEKYLPVNRTVVATGAQSGARELRMAINPWNLNSSSEKFKDLEHSDVPAAQLATAEQTDKSLKASSAGSTVRHLDLANLPISNSPMAPRNGQPTRLFKVEIKPSLVLTDITGQPANVAFSVTAGKLLVSAALVESLTSGGRETKSTVSQTAAVPVKVEGGRIYAELPLTISRGSEASRFMLAVKVDPVDGPKGLLAFEGLFALGDLHSITEEGSMSGELKASNADGNFDYTTVAGRQLYSGTGPQPELGGANNTSRRTNLFKMSTLVPSWSGPVNEDVANHRTVMYSVRACFLDLSNGSRPAVNETFKVKKADGSEISVVASDRAEKLGCIDWEDKIKHKYYAPEKWTVIPTTVSHASGYQETQNYVVAPWGAWSFTVDAGAKADFINQINTRRPSPSRLLVDGVEMNSGMNTRDVYSYEVDKYLSMQMIKRVTLRIPMRVFRPSNIRDGANMVPELARTGKYLFKAALVAPIHAVNEKKGEMLISPMRGLHRIVEVRGGELKAEVDFAISDIRLMNARTYLVFEVKIVDEDKLPASDPFLRNSNVNPETVVDYEAGAIMPTYVAPLFLKNEKDFAFTMPVGDLSLDLARTDSADLIPNRPAVSDRVKEAIRPFSDMNVDKLIAKARDERSAYRARMEREVGLGLFARRANTEFVSLRHEAAVLRNEVLMRTNNQFLPNNGRAIDTLLSELNKPLRSHGADKTALIAGANRPQITRAVLADFIKGDKAFDKKLAAQMCGFFFSTLPNARLNAAQMAALERLDRGAWVDDCLMQVAARGGDSVFMRDRRVRAIEVNPVARKLRGRSMVFQIGSEVHIDKSSSKSWGYGIGLGSGGLTGEMSRMFKNSGSKAMRIFTAAPDRLGISADIGVRSDHATAVGSAAAFASVTELTMEQNELLIEITKSEECMIVRPRPQFVEGGARLRFGAVKMALGQDRAEELMSRGIMICNGVVTKTQVAERFYTFGHDQAGANNLDPHAVENLPWLLSLRGQRDYATFLLLSSASQTTVNDAQRVQIDIGDMPLNRLEESYKQYFAGKMASMPGYVTHEPKIVRVRNDR